MRAQDIQETILDSTSNSVRSNCIQFRIQLHLSFLCLKSKGLNSLPITFGLYITAIGRIYKSTLKEMLGLSHKSSFKSEIQEWLFMFQSSSLSAMVLHGHSSQSNLLYLDLVGVDWMDKGYGSAKSSGSWGLIFPCGVLQMYGNILVPTVPEGERRHLLLIPLLG